MQQQMLELHRELLQDHVTYLQENLIVDEKFYGKLLSSNVFEEEQIQQIKSKATTDAGIVLELVKLVKKRGPEAFNNFMKACRDTGQAFIADSLINWERMKLEEIPYENSQQVYAILRHFMNVERKNKTVEMNKLNEYASKLVQRIDYEALKYENGLLAEHAREMRMELDTVEEELEQYKQLEFADLKQKSEIKKLQKMIGENKQTIETYKSQQELDEKEKKMVIEKLIEQHKQDMETYKKQKEFDEREKKLEIEKMIVDHNQAIKSQAEKLQKSEEQSQNVKGIDALVDANEELAQLNGDSMYNEIMDKYSDKRANAPILLQLNVYAVKMKTRHIEDELEKAKRELKEMCENEDTFEDVNTDNKELMTYIKFIKKNNKKKMEKKMKEIKQLETQLDVAHETEVELQTAIEKHKEESKELRDLTKEMEEKFKTLEKETMHLKPPVEKFKLPTLPPRGKTKQYLQNPTCKPECQPRKRKLSNNNLPFTEMVERASNAFSRRYSTQ